MCSFRTGRRDARVIKLDRPRGDHTKSERERLIPCDIIHMWNPKKKKRYKCTYLQNRNRHTDKEDKLMVTKSGKGGADKSV